MSKEFAAETKVLMVNFYSAEFTVQAIKSLEEVGFTCVSIWSNGDSNAGTLLLQQLKTQNPRIEIFFSDKNIGFGSAINELVAHDKDAAKVYWVLNPDCLVLSADFSDIENWKNNTMSKTLICPLIVSGQNQRFVWFAGGDINLKSRQVEHKGYGSHPGILELNKNSFSFLSGASFFIKRSHFLEVGGFDSSIFLYFEDLDFSIRASRAGFEFFLDPSIVVWHKEGGSNTTKSSKSSSYYFNTNMNRIVVFSKHFGLSGWLKPTTIIATLRSILLPIKEPLRKYYVYFSVAGFLAGSVRALRDRMRDSKCLRN
jgi:GT2 family glycosyltransferase